jgi:hypothetical protein
MGIKKITLLHVHGTLWHFGSKERLDDFFIFFLTVHLRIILVGDQLDAQFFL